MVYTLRLTGNEIRIVLRSMGRYAKRKLSEGRAESRQTGDDALSLALRIESEFNRQRGKKGSESNEQNRRNEGQIER